tara:strand:- start:389 stop:1399 length:1011 start_codon:yes stop_codon:yes gene_type:complete
MKNFKLNDLNNDSIDDIISDVTSKKTNSNIKNIKQNNDNIIINDSDVINITNNNIKFNKDDIDILDENIKNKSTINENENQNIKKILSGDVYSNVNDTYYQNLDDYDINKHGIGNSPIITDIQNVNKQRRMTNASISNFYNYDYTHLCHPDNILYDIEIIKSLSNDYEFQYDSRDIGHYDNIINKFLNTDLINLKRHKTNLTKILLILDQDAYKYDKKKLIIYFNEWLLNNNWVVISDDNIVINFIKVFKNFNHHYQLLFNKKTHYQQQQKVNTTAFNVSESSVFYDTNINESHSLKNNNSSLNYYNKDYFSNRPSVKYSKSPLIPQTYSFDQPQL